MTLKIKIIRKLLKGIYIGMLCNTFKIQKYIFFASF